MTQKVMILTLMNRNIKGDKDLSQLQWNPVNTDANGTCPSVRINGVSVLSGLSEKTLQTHVLSKKRPKQTLFYGNKRFNCT